MSPLGGSALGPFEGLTNIKPPALPGDIYSIRKATQLNGIMVGVVTNGLFAHRGADVVLIGTPDGMVTQ